MSHEIRTPMNGIIGVLDLLEEAKTNPSDEEIYYLNTIRTSSNTLLNIINDVLDLSKLEAGKTVLRKEDFSIEEAIQQIPSLFKGNALKKNISIRTEIDSKLPKYLKSDINRLIQILSNLASNAIKFSDENSEVIIRASLIDKKDNDVKMRFEVTDFGIGISENDQKRLFQAFNQVDLSRTKKFEGTGLGLAICKQLVELFDGNIGVLSNQGQGSTFWFTLNSEIGKASEKTKSQKNNAHEKFEGIRVLLVDDMNVNLLVAKAMLEKLKCEVTTAKNGKEAVNTFKPNLFDIVLMDIQMPELDGLEATKIIQKEHGKSVPIVALTANAMEGDKETYLNSGMDGYIAKPVTLDQLKEVIGNLVG